MKNLLVIILFFLLTIFLPSKYESTPSPSLRRDDLYANPKDYHLDHNEAVNITEEDGKMVVNVVKKGKGGINGGGDLLRPRAAKKNIAQFHSRKPDLIHILQFLVLLPMLLFT